jgi:hypothetical protein
MEKTREYKNKIMREWYAKNKEKQRAYQKKWYKENFEKYKDHNNERGRIWRKKNINKSRKYMREWTKIWRKNNPEKLKIMLKNSHITARMDVLYFYGGNPPKCACCGEKHIEFLEIDHINNNGAEDRRNNKLMAGGSTYHHLRKNKYPKGFEIQCSNCNQSRGKYGYCPHKLKLKNR